MALRPAMRIQMKPHTGRWGVLAGLVLMYFGSSLNGTPPLPLFPVLVAMFVFFSGFILSVWGVWSWWSDRYSRSRQAP